MCAIVTAGSHLSLTGLDLSYLQHFEMDRAAMHRRASDTSLTDDDSFTRPQISRAHSGRANSVDSNALVSLDVQNLMYKRV